MRQVTVIGMVVVVVLSALITGTIFAQDGGTGQTQKGWLGVRLADTEAGVVVNQVNPGSPAETAGLQTGDVIVSVDGTAVDSAAAVVEAVQAQAPGDTISIVVTRDGSEQTFEVELGTAPGRGDRLDLFASGEIDPLVMAEMVLHVELDKVDSGYQVLAGGMRAEASDLQVGDVISAVNGTAIEDVDWAALVTELAASDSPTLSLTVQRSGEEVTVEASFLGGLGGLGGHGGPGGRGGQGGFEGRGRDFDGQGLPQQPGTNAQPDNGQQPNDNAQPDSSQPSDSTPSEQVLWQPA